MSSNDVLARYDELLNLCDRFKRKGKTVPHTAANGYMFTLFNKDGEIGIRFSKEVQEKYLTEFSTTLYKSHGATMKGYILITTDLLDDTEKMLELINESFDYVMSLPTK